MRGCVCMQSVMYSSSSKYESDVNCRSIHFRVLKTRAPPTTRERSHSFRPRRRTLLIKLPGPRARFYGKSRNSKGVPFYLLTPASPNVKGHFCESSELYTFDAFLPLLTDAEKKVYIFNGVNKQTYGFCDLERYTGTAE